MDDLIEIGDAFWAYPLEWGDTLSNHDWVPLYVNRLLGSRFVSHAIAEDRRADIGTALLLWSASFAQDPAGTLPDDDIELAQLAKFGADVEAWRKVRKGVLYGWSFCHVDGERMGGSGADRRLGHPMIAAICKDMYKRKRGRDQSREAGNVAVLRTRVKAKLKAIGQNRASENPNVVEQLATWLRQFGLYCTEDNVRSGLEAVAGVPKVVGMGMRSESD